MPMVMDLGLTESCMLALRTSATRETGARFTQVRGPQRGKTLTSCLSGFIALMSITMELPKDNVGGDLAEIGKTMVDYA
jgi:hypothetical protein